MAFSKPTKPAATTVAEANTVTFASLMSVVSFALVSGFFLCQVLLKPRPLYWIVLAVSALFLVIGVWSLRRKLST